MRRRQRRGKRNLETLCKPSPPLAMGLALVAAPALVVVRQVRLGGRARALNTHTLHRRLAGLARGSTR